MPHAVVEPRNRAERLWVERGLRRLSENAEDTVDDYILDLGRQTDLVLVRKN